MNKPILGEVELGRTSIRDRARSAALWLGVPLLVGIAEAGEPWWDYPVYDPPWLGYALVFYAGALVSLAILLGVAGWEVSRHQRNRRAWWLPTYFLPTYVAAFESLREFADIFTLHCSTDECVRFNFTYRMIAAVVAMAGTVVGGVVVAMLRRHPSRWGLPIHPVVVALVAGGVLPWGSMVYLFWAAGASLSWEAVLWQLWTGRS